MKSQEVNFQKSQKLLAYRAAGSSKFRSRQKPVFIFVQILLILMAWILVSVALKK